ncbi:ethylene-responsive transcription factor ERF017-like [Senna tora]|uniref:Ethylene-responsive transcription factor ERF017-like n=1 Tax=Senna tora TaxID=362788 RepID=A0A834X286_9FABA|nr:ethylene-responsive transcription factor ERF017-like [Senna tora]
MVKKHEMENVASEERNEGSHKYKGVRKRKWGKWVSEIRLPNSRERIWLGSYDTAEKAARAFDAAMFCLRGRNARFNFPDNPPDIAGGRSLTPSQIQLAAARFANAEEPRHNHTTSYHHPSSLSLSHSASSSTTLLPVESQSRSDSDVTLNGSFPDLFTAMGNSGNYASDYGIFPGFDDLNNSDFYTPEMPRDDDYGEEHVDGHVGQDSFLWNF